MLKQLTRIRVTLTSQGQVLSPSRRRLPSRTSWHKINSNWLLWSTSIRTVMHSYIHSMVDRKMTLRTGGQVSWRSLLRFPMRHRSPVVRWRVRVKRLWDWHLVEIRMTGPLTILEYPPSPPNLATSVNLSMSGNSKTLVRATKSWGSKVSGWNTCSFTCQSTVK